MELWILITIGAAAAQSLRFMLQKRLTGMALSTAGATFARFIYSSPLVAVIAVTYANTSGQGAPVISSGAEKERRGPPRGAARILAKVRILPIPPRRPAVHLGPASPGRYSANQARTCPTVTVP